MSFIVNLGRQPIQPAPTFIDYVENFITQSPSTVQAMTASLWKVYSFFIEYTQKPIPKAIDLTNRDIEESDLSILAEALLHRQSISQDARWIKEGEEPKDGTMYVTIGTDAPQRKMSAY